MEAYDPDTWFSSIDARGRSRFRNQPEILGWTFARLAEQSFGADEATLPKGVDALKVTSQHDSADNALELAKGEEATLPVTLSAENMEDGALALQPELSLQSAEDNQEAQLPLQLKGSMTTPLSKSAFGLAFALAVLLGLLIPLAVLYFMKWFSGRIPESPRMFAKTIPVKKDGTSLIRTDTGKPFVVSKDEFQGAVPCGYLLRVAH